MIAQPVTVPDAPLALAEPEERIRAWGRAAPQQAVALALTRERPAVRRPATACPSCHGRSSMHRCLDCAHNRWTLLDEEGWIEAQLVAGTDREQDLIISTIRLIDRSSPRSSAPCRWF